MAVLLVWGLSCGRSAADVHVSGTQNRFVLQTQDATIREILAALSSAFDLDVKLKGDSARKFTGAYSGSLRQVLSRLLTGEDYILRSASDGMSIILLGASTADSVIGRPALQLPATPGSRLVALRQARQAASMNKPQ
ncbi:MAG TPA: hypothetical protein VK337_08530 [Xanthobacteraceae bacterium]|nr:hypothetical protein [Xanthobacteraceae bacterium]